MWTSKLFKRGPVWDIGLLARNNLAVLAVVKLLVLLSITLTLPSADSVEAIGNYLLVAGLAKRRRRKSLIESAPV